uniref:F-box domain-containing protein n=1 Tax=Caenorhabditis japonica TaxID=281687 RepID=A0A8R1EUW9_CAEJA
MRREIVKHTDLLTRIRLRACSKLDREIVDSLSINIPFVRLKADYDDFTITFIEHPKSVLKVDVSKRKFRKNRAVVHL